MFWYAESNYELLRILSHRRRVSSTKFYRQDFFFRSKWIHKTSEDSIIPLFISLIQALITVRWSVTCQVKKDNNRSQFSYGIFRGTSSLVENASATVSWAILLLMLIGKLYIPWSCPSFPSKNMCIRARSYNAISIWKVFYRSKFLASKEWMSWNLHCKVSSLSKFLFSPHHLELEGTIHPLHIIIKKPHKPGKLDFLYNGKFKYCPILKLWK